MSTDQLIFCPGGCGRQLHRRANTCPNCGYRAETANFDELLSSVSMVSAVIVGFVLAALVTIVCTLTNPMKDNGIVIAIGCWIFASILLLAIVPFAAYLRHRDITFGRIEPPDLLEAEIRGRCRMLLSVFTISLIITALGLILVAFAFSTLLGIVAVIGAIIAGWLTEVILT